MNFGLHGQFLQIIRFRVLSARSPHVHFMWPRWPPEHYKIMFIEAFSNMIQETSENRIDVCQGLPLSRQIFLLSHVLPVLEFLNFMAI